MTEVRIDKSKLIVHFDELPEITPEVEARLAAIAQRHLDNMWERCFPTPAPTTYQLPRPRCACGVVCLCNMA